MTVTSCDKVYEKLRAASIKYLSVPRTSKEVITKLTKIGLENAIDSTSLEECIALVVKGLRDDNLLDDLEYAKTYCAQEIANPNPSSPFEISKFLYRKGIARSHINQVLTAYTPDVQNDVIARIVRKKNKYTRDKLIQYLARRGFSINIIQHVLDTI